MKTPEWVGLLSRIVCALEGKPALFQDPVALDVVWGALRHCLTKAITSERFPGWPAVILTSYMEQAAPHLKQLAATEGVSVQAARLALWLAAEPGASTDLVGPFNPDVRRRPSMWPQHSPTSIPKTSPSPPDEPNAASGSTLNAMMQWILNRVRRRPAE